ncbi:unnamed protein product, partial [Polarella glacialis]
VALAFGLLTLRSGQAVTFAQRSKLLTGSPLQAAKTSRGATASVALGDESASDALRLAAEPALSPERRSEWWTEFLLILAGVAISWTALDCALDPGVNIWDPVGLARIALPTALLVAPGAAVAACARLKPLPRSLPLVRDAAQKRDCAVVFVGDSLTQGTLSANILEVLTQQHQDIGDLINFGMNMRPLSEACAGSLLDDAVALKPKHGIVLLLGTNDLIRYAALPALLRQPPDEWLEGYASNLRHVADRLRPGGSVLLASPPPLGEELSSDEGRLGAEMAARVKQVASEAGCKYVPLWETVAQHLEAARRNGVLAPGSRAYSLPESLALLCALPWRLYAGSGTGLSELQAEQGLELTVDLVHYGPRFAEMAAKVYAESLGLPSRRAD